MTPFGLQDAVAVPVGLGDLNPVCERIEEGPGEPLAAQHAALGLEGQVRRTRRLVCSLDSNEVISRQGIHAVRYRVIQGESEGLLFITSKLNILILRGIRVGCESG